jgi:ferritin-like metal-binding protein YciE
LAAQKVEHYEIATYGGLAQLATTLGLSEIADLLNETLAIMKLLLKSNNKYYIDYIPQEFI